MNDMNDDDDDDDDDGGGGHKLLHVDLDEEDRKAYDALCE